MSEQPPTPSIDRTKSNVGMTLMVLGLASWVAMIAIIVYRNTTTGAKPTVLFIVATIACWVVFFVGKSMVKFQNNKLEPKSPPTND